jgi:hypothetical protein
MNIFEFINHFPNEESCESFLKTYRENTGKYCKMCKCISKHYWFSEKYLQNYLNEFVYKLNRRYFGEKLFNRLIVASIYPYV